MSDEVIEKDFLSRAPEHFRKRLDADHLAIVFDTNTYDVLAHALCEALKGHYKLTPISLGKKPAPLVDTAMRLRQQAASCDAIIAVGSGTINDICKYAATRAEIPYIVCATAPSMNGYMSATASLMVGRRKYSLACQPPRAVYADIDILCRAPRRLIRAGLGDVLCRSTVQVDWLLSHLLLGTDYDATLFNRICALETEMLPQTRQISDKDPTFIRMLMKMLNVSGAAMADYGSSAPASQGEHLIAHAYEYFYGSDSGPESFHGEQISVTSLTMVRMQEKMLLRRPTIKPTVETAERFNKLFGREEGDPMYHAYQRKAISPKRAEELNDRLETEWKGIKATIEAVRVPATKLENALKAANCPLTPADIQWHPNRYEHAVTQAYLIRDRFTFLDLASMDKTLRFAS